MATAPLARPVFAVCQRLDRCSDKSLMLGDAVRCPSDTVGKMPVRVTLSVWGWASPTRCTGREVVAREVAAGRTMQASWI